MDYAENIVDQLDAELEEERSESPVVEHRWVAVDKGTRSIAFTNLELRAMEDGEDDWTVRGYAAVFDSPSEPLPFTEYVKRGAFKKTIKDRSDVRLLIDHTGVPLARTKSGTLTLTEDDRGLFMEARLDPANPDAVKIRSALKRGDLSQMSFAFQTVKDSWNSDRTVRELKEVRLHDVSIVTYPAYEETTAEMRNNQTTDTSVGTVAPISLRKAQVLLAKARAVK
jgi:HK97 family phage prohead protease